MSRNCLNDPDNFCYICGELTFKEQRRNLTSLVKKCYELYFECKVGDQNKKWAPHICCSTCVKRLTDWAKGSRHMTFAVPMVWREPQDHSSDCYFCITKVKGITRKSKHTVKYPNLKSAMRPIPHSEDLPVPQPPTDFTVEDCEHDEETNMQHEQEDDDPPFEDSASSSEPHFLNQGDLNDLVRDLNLSKKQSELLASRLNGWNLLQKDTKVCLYRNRHALFRNYFSQEKNLVYCNSICCVMAEFGVDHKAVEWRLFIDSSKTSLKAVLLHNGNKLPSVPIAYSSKMKESYEELKFLLEKIQYKEYCWTICCDLKVVASLMGLQHGYTKFCCFLCEWDSRDKKNHYVRNKWPVRTCLTPGEKNVQHVPLVTSDAIILPALHIKLGLFKNFVKAMNKNGDGFHYLKKKFPGVSDAKIKEGIFVGPQIRALIADTNFDALLSPGEKSAWNAFKLVVANFLGNHKSHNYRQLVLNLLEAYKNLGCNMSLKIHFLDSHLDFFPANLGAVSDEHGERFHQDVSDMENRYHGQWNEHMLADYCWTLKRDVPVAKYSRKSNAVTF